MGRPFVHRLRVRYGECDPQNIVFNAHYLAYFDIALTELWREALPGGYRAMMDAGIDLVVAEATCRYRTPAHFDDLLDVEVGIAALGTTSMQTEMTVRRDTTVVVEGTMRHVFVDVATRRNAPIPRSIRKALARWS
jgi:acyl-CoA thioester hydrolase